MASASAFTIAAAWNSGTPWAENAQKATAVAGTQLKAWAGEASKTANVAGAWVAACAKAGAGWAVREDKAFFAWYDPAHRLAPKSYPKPQLAHGTPPVLRPSIVPEPEAVQPRPPVVAAPLAVSPALPPAPTIAEAKLPAAVSVLPPPSATKQPLQLADQAPPPPAGFAPVPDAHPPSPAELDRVLTHLKVSLTGELYDNFDLFLYVSKADKGPWAQRMYVFQKETDGNLKMLYEWPVSTGRELIEMAPDGHKESSFTPQGYYELDPHRMYEHYHSSQWDQSMPYAMFFNWEKDGYQTGLAIHGAVGADISLLGERSSAGCVHLDPKDAALLFHLIRDHYKGLSPRFAYDRRTATMANNGFLMHDKAGNLEYEEGYKVLVFIENNGGSNVVAALF